LSSTLLHCPLLCFTVLYSASLSSTLLLCPPLCFTVLSSSALVLCPLSFSVLHSHSLSSTLILSSYGLLSDVAGKVIHLVERAPPQTSQSGGGGGGVSSGGTEGGATTSSQGGPQDRNGNSYVMLGTFNLPVNIMDPQQIQVSQGCVLVCTVQLFHSLYSKKNIEHLKNVLNQTVLIGTKCVCRIC
jgi:hypothetical protein